MAEAIEIKLTATPTLHHAAVLDRWRTLAGSAAAPKGVLVCRIAEQTALPSNNLALPWQEFPRWLAAQLKER
ncbi:MAG TPA: hypothetical protein VHR45_23910 [Thermoanaerobaculia bacterium]|nr:hypothetical protein [Thermoanaerobaculia bacterium]